MQFEINIGKSQKAQEDKKHLTFGIRHNNCEGYLTQGVTSKS
jgi:hypothetical protein